MMEAQTLESDGPAIDVHGLTRAIEDGVLAPVFVDLWPLLSRGKPIVATAVVNADVSHAGLAAIWDAFVDWQRDVEPTLPEAERLFATTVNGQTVWVIEDGSAITFLYPSDYEHEPLPAQKGR